MVDVNKTNDHDKDQDEELHCSEEVVQPDTPFSRDGVKHTGESVRCQCNGNYFPGRSIHMCCVKNVLCERDGVCGCVFEDDKGYSEEAGCEEQGFLEEVVELSSKELVVIRRVFW